MSVLFCLNGPNSLTPLILTLVDFEAPGKSSPPTFSGVLSLTGHNTLLSAHLVPATLLTNLLNPALARLVPATPLTKLSNPAFWAEHRLLSMMTPGVYPHYPSQPVNCGISVHLI